MQVAHKITTYQYDIICSHPPPALSGGGSFCQWLAQGWGKQGLGVNGRNHHHCWPPQQDLNYVCQVCLKIAQLSFENGHRYSKHVRKPQFFLADAISFTFSAQEKIRYSGTLLAMLNFGQVPAVGRCQVVVSNISVLSKQVGRMILGMIRSDSIFRLKFSRDLWTWHSWMAQAPKHLRFHSIHVR